MTLELKKKNAHSCNKTEQFGRGFVQMYLFFLNSDFLRILKLKSELRKN